MRARLSESSAGCQVRSAEAPQTQCVPLPGSRAAPSGCLVLTLVTHTPAQTGNLLRKGLGLPCISPELANYECRGKACALSSSPSNVSIRLVPQIYQRQVPLCIMHARAQNWIDYAAICHNPAKPQELTLHTIGENRPDRDCSGQGTVGSENSKPSYQRYVSDGKKSINK